ncbi:MAG TPA: HAMP domain-containing sensor histidine kinase [Bacteriovoracaceae bacterium]|nr:HAMP domain-containing sensor histidine kinase [Bacteriovoracaceae bacterium]
MPDQTSNRLKKHTNEILNLWEQRTWEEVKAAKNQKSLALRDSLPEYLLKLAEALSGTIDRTAARNRMDKIELTRLGKKHGMERANSMHYTIDQLIMEYHILRQVICDVMDKDQILTPTELEVIVCSIEQAVSDAATEFSENMEVFAKKAALEDELRETVRSRDEFLSIVSHELKTPLTSLKLEAEMLLKYTDDGVKKIKKNRDFANHVNNQISRLSHLIDYIVDFGRIRAGNYRFEFEKVNINDVISEVIEKSDNIFQAFKLAPPEFICHGDAMVQIDKVKIEQVINNILTNAIKYGRGRPISIEVFVQNNEVEIIVRDQGMGIDPTSLDRIFKRFERAISPNEVTGLGLGLYITKEILSAHEGRIWVESQLGRGSDFHFTLPTADMNH